MFHWICPECGREIAPTVRECPVCDPNAVVAEPALVGVVEAPTARTRQEVGPPASIATESAPPVRADKAESAPPVRADKAESAPSVRAGKATESGSPLPSVDPAPSAVAPLARTSKKPSALLRLRKEAPRAVPVREHPPLPTEPILPQLGAAPSGDPLADLSALMAEDPAPAASVVAEPPCSDHRFPMTSPVPAVPPALRAWLAALAPATEAAVPVTGSTPAKPLAEPPLVRTKMDLPSLSARNMRAPALHPSGVTQVFEPPTASKTAEPQTPYAGPAPAMAPLANYSPLAGRPLRPAIPSRAVLQRELGLRCTLPGPMLTPRLAKFKDRELNPILPPRFMGKKRLIPGWAASVLIVGTVLVAGFTSIFTIVPKGGGAEGKAAAVIDVEASSNPNPSSVPPPPETNSLSKAIEVTGFRIQMDLAKKPEIQYLVVNHTSSRFSGVTVYVTLHAAHETPGQPPIGRFQFGAPDLKPYESKEMASAIERVNRPGDLPDWQDLRAEVEIGQ